MRHQDSAEIEAEILTNIAADASARRAHPWLMEGNTSPTLHALAVAVITDLERQAAKLCAFSTHIHARNIADELLKAARELRYHLRPVSPAKADVWRYAQEISKGMMALAMGQHSVREALGAAPDAPKEVPKVDGERAPPKRLGGRLPYAVKVPKLGEGEPWQRWLKVRGPGRPSRHDRGYTDEQNIAQAKLAFMHAKMRGEVDSQGNPIRKSARRKPVAS